MKKIITGILIIALICVTSGAYAVLSENSTVNTDNISTAPVDYKIDSDNLPIEQSLSITPSTHIKENDAEKVIYVGKYAYYNESDGLDDSYLECVQCGGFVPIGTVTMPLPDAALCHNFVDRFSSDYKDYSISYGDAYQRWVNLGQPVFDDGSKIHEETADPGINTPYPSDIISDVD